MANVITTTATALTQDEWDSFLVSTTKGLSDLDAEAGAKVAKLGADNVPLEVLESEPATPAEGDIYYDAVDGVFKRYNGSVWETVEFVMKKV